MNSVVCLRRPFHPFKRLRRLKLNFFQPSVSVLIKIVPLTLSSKNAQFSRASGGGQPRSVCRGCGVVGLRSLPCSARDDPWRRRLSYAFCKDKPEQRLYYQRHNEEIGFIKFNVPWLDSGMTCENKVKIVLDLFKELQWCHDCTSCFECLLRSLDEQLRDEVFGVIGDVAEGIIIEFEVGLADISQSFHGVSSSEG